MTIAGNVTVTVVVSVMTLGAATVSAQTSAAGAGQDYPNKPIRIITAAAGGSNDFTSRLIAQGLAGPMGQPLIVDNRAGGMVAGDMVSKAPPDGYTLLEQSNSVWIGPLLQKAPYDPVADLAPITAIAKAPNMLAMHPGVSATSVKELIALAKAKPGELNYASGGTGGGSHLSAELFKYLAGINVVRVAYKGGAAALIDLLAGRVQLLFEDFPTLAPNVKLGKLRALAVTSAEQSSLAPALPTLASAGVPGYVFESTQVIWGPAKTPQTAIRRVNQEIVRLINQADVRDKLFNNGLEPVGNSPEQLAAMIRSDMASMGKVIQAAGIRAD